MDGFGVLVMWGNLLTLAGFSRMGVWEQYDGVSLIARFLAIDSHPMDRS